MVFFLEGDAFEQVGGDGTDDLFDVGPADAFCDDDVEVSVKKKRLQHLQSTIIAEAARIINTLDAEKAVPRLLHHRPQVGTEDGVAVDHQLRIVADDVATSFTIGGDANAVAGLGLTAGAHSPAATGGSDTWNLFYLEDA